MVAAGEMSRQLRELASLAEDLGLSSSTHIRKLTTTCNSSSSGDSPLVPTGPRHASGAQTYMQVHTRAHVCTYVYICMRAYVYWDAVL